MTVDQQSERNYAEEIEGANTITISGITNWGFISRQILESMASQVGITLSTANDTSAQFHGDERLSEEQTQKLGQLLSDLAKTNPKMQVTTA